MEEKISEIVLALTKAVKASQIYSITHPSFNNFFIPLHQKLTDWLKEYLQLNFQIERFTIRHANRSVYEETDKDLSIAFRLFRDGIREINFYEGLSPDELLLFIATISQPTKEQDIALSLWECDFSHINFYVVDEDEEVITYRIPETPAAEVDYDMKIVEILEKEDISLPDPNDLNLSHEEQKNLRSEILNGEKKSLLPLAITILTNILNIDKSEEIISSLTELLEICINQKEFANACKIMYKLQKFTRTNPLARFENEATILGFKNLLNSLNDRAFNEFITFIGFFSKKTIPHFMKIITAVKSNNRLESLRRQIAYLCQDDITPIINLLKADNIEIVTNTIAILGIMKSKEAIAFLEPLLIHSDHRVRSALLSALANIGEPKMVIAFLDDPVKSIRIMALQELAQIPYSKTYSELQNRIEAKKFFALEFNEQREYFNCLVAQGGNNLIKYLEKLLFKRVFFHRKRYLLMRKLSALSLTQVSNEAASKILQAGLRKRNKDIRTACALALATMSRKEETK